MMKNGFIWNDDDIININNILFKVMDEISKLEIEPFKIVTLFECKGYELICCKKSKIIMREPSSNKKLNIYFRYNKDCTKKILTGIRFKQ
jgi:hypothetical protein